MKPFRPPPLHGASLSINLQGTSGLLCNESSLTLCQGLRPASLAYLQALPLSLCPGPTQGKDPRPQQGCHCLRQECVSTHLSSICLELKEMVVSAPQPGALGGGQGSRRVSPAHVDRERLGHPVQEGHGWRSKASSCAGWCSPKGLCFSTWGLLATTVPGTSGSLRLAHCGAGRQCKQVSQARLWGKFQIHRNAPHDGVERGLQASTDPGLGPGLEFTKCGWASHPEKHPLFPNTSLLYPFMLCHVSWKRPSVPRSRRG